MRKYEDHCYDCAVPGYPCEGSLCKLKNVPVDYCDTENCHNYAEYRVEDKDHCEECAKEYLEEIFDGLTVLEQAELLKVNFSIIND